MKISLEPLTVRESQFYERTKGPLHPWAERLDSRTGFAYCNTCSTRSLQWSFYKSSHPEFEILEEMDYAVPFKHV